MPAAVKAGTHLHHMQLQSAEAAQFAAFHADAMVMTGSPLDRDEWLCEGPQRRLLFTAGESRKLGYCALGVRDEDSLLELREAIERGGIAIHQSPSPLFTAGAFAIRGPDWNLFVFGVASQNPPRKCIRGPLQHLTLAMEDLQAIEDVYV